MQLPILDLVRSPPGACPSKASISYCLLRFWMSICIPEKEAVFLFSLYLSFNNSWDSYNPTPCLVNRLLAVFVCLKLLTRTTFLFSLLCPSPFVPHFHEHRLIWTCPHPIPIAGIPVCFFPHFKLIYTEIYDVHTPTSMRYIFGPILWSVLYVQMYMLMIQ